MLVVKEFCRDKHRRERNFREGCVVDKQRVPLRLGPGRGPTKDEVAERRCPLSTSFVDHLPCFPETRCLPEGGRYSSTLEIQGTNFSGYLSGGVVYVETTLPFIPSVPTKRIRTQDKNFLPHNLKGLCESPGLHPSLRTKSPYPPPSVSTWTTTH